MKPTLLAIRSIGAEFANRLYVTVASITIIVTIGVVSIAIWLTTLSYWWWLLCAALVLVVSVVIGLLIITKLLIRSFTPPRSDSQKKQTKAFVDKLQLLFDATQQSQFMLLFHIVRDIAAPRENGFVASLSQDSTSLKHDFLALCKTFK